MAELRAINDNHRILPAKDTCWTSSISFVYIRTTKDKALWPATQDKLLAIMADLPNSKWNVVDMACGHSPFLSHVSELCEILIRVLPTGS